MPLPKINTPTYELTLPSNNKKIKYRPFLVREEKILIMALETENSEDISNAVVDILSECILTKGVDVTKLATFDIEYLFLNVRAKSVGKQLRLISHVLMTEKHQCRLKLILIQSRFKRLEVIRISSNLIINTQ